MEGSRRNRGGQRPSASGPDGFEDEARSAYEDAVVRDERDSEAERSGCDPAVGVVVTLAEGVPTPCASDPHFGLDADELAALWTISARAISASRRCKRWPPPAAEEGVMAELGDNLEGEKAGRPTRRASYRWVSDDPGVSRAL